MACCVLASQLRAELAGAESKLKSMHTHTLMEMMMGTHTQSGITVIKGVGVARSHIHPEFDASNGNNRYYSLSPCLLAAQKRHSTRVSQQPNSC